MEISRNDFFALIDSLGEQLYVAADALEVARREMGIIDDIAEHSDVIEADRVPMRQAINSLQGAAVNFVSAGEAIKEVIGYLTKGFRRGQRLSGSESISKDLRKDLEKMAGGMSNISIGSINMAGIVRRGIDKGDQSEEVLFLLGDMAKWLAEFQGELEGLGSMFSDVRWDYEQIAKAEEDAAIRDRHR